MSEETIPSLFSSAVENGPDRPFLWVEGETITYEDAADLVDQYAAMLHDRGIGDGDRVCVLSENCPEFVYLLLATAKLGATFVPLDYRQEGDILEYLLNDASPAILVVGERAYEPFQSIADAVEIDEILYHDVDQKTRSQSLRKGIESADPHVDVGTDPEPTDIAIINYTSGSTGPPKGVQNPHRAFVEAGNRIADRCGTDEHDRGLVVLPLFHANPQTYALMHMLSSGGSLALTDGFSASGFWPTARKSESTFFTHVGSVLEILNRKITEESVDTETPLEFTLGGAAQFDDQSNFESVTGIHIIRLYGLSEMGAGVVTMNRRTEGVHGKAHQGPISDHPFDVNILDPSGSGWVKTGESGEIVIRPAKPGTMFQGYLEKHGETVDAWQDLWMHTGDLGFVDEDDNLHYVGRLKTSIRKNGENISPWEIETVVTSFPAVEEAVAVGVPDSVAGEEIKLFVILSDESISEKQIYEQCEAELPAHLVPRYVESIDELPRTSTQKVERVALKNRDVDGGWDFRTERPE